MLNPDDFPDCEHCGVPVFVIPPGDEIACRDCTDHDDRPSSPEPRSTSR